jgi:hypothetical protein
MRRQEILKQLGQRSQDMRHPPQSQQPGASGAEARSNTVEQLEERIRHLESLYVGLVDLLADANASGVAVSEDKGDLSRDLQRDLVVDGVSLDKINEFVDSVLSTSTTNLGWIPDALERKIYRRLLQLALGLVAKGLTTAKVKVGDGHELTFSLSPAEKADGMDDATAEGAEDEVEQASAAPSNLDRVVFDALKTILSSLQVDFLNHKIQFHLE